MGNNGPLVITAGLLLLLSHVSVSFKCYYCYYDKNEADANQGQTTTKHPFKGSNTVDCDIGTFNATNVEKVECAATATACRVYRYKHSTLAHTNVERGCADLCVINATGITATFGGTTTTEYTHCCNTGDLCNTDTSGMNVTTQAPELAGCSGMRMDALLLVGTALFGLLFR